MMSFGPPAVVLTAGQGGAAPVAARSVRSPWAVRLWSFAMVVGPGLIVMVADNDAGAVSTYTQAGALYGTRLLWFLAALLPCTYFIQEMVVRLGIATGRGLTPLIYQRFGARWGALNLVSLLVANFLTLVTEFAMVTLCAAHLGVRPGVAVPLAAGGLLALVLTGSYRRWERATIFLCAFDLLWLAFAARLSPGAGVVARDLVVPRMPLGGVTPQLLFLLVAIVGTTIAPWQLFFQQSCVVDKRLRFRDLPWARLDTFIGGLVVIGMAVCMVVVGDALRRTGAAYADPGQMAVALAAQAGPWVSHGLLLLMVNAAVLGATTISLASAWAYGEVKGWPHSLQRSPREAPLFYALYLVCITLAGGLVLLPGAPLQLIIVGVQVCCGIVLPVMLVFLQLLCTDRELLGDQFVNRPWNNVVNTVIIAVLFGLSTLLALQVLVPQRFAGH